MNLKQEMEELYEMWIFSNCDDEFGCKEGMIKLIENRHRYDEFVKEVKEVIE